MKALYLVLFSLGFCLEIKAQPKVAVRMVFNPEQNRYEVLATPNFSARNFTWGPSQVSVVLPASQSKNPLAVRSTVGGTWSDNSIVTQPAAAPGSLFHGITTGGGTVNLVAGEQVLLFDFALPTGFVDQVRLFNNASDPNSAQEGMRGGDFRSYMSDETGADYLAAESAPVALSVLQDASALGKVADEQLQIQLIAYPNPASGGVFRLFLKGFAPEETVTVRLSGMTGVEQKRLTDKVMNLTGRAITVPDGSSPYLLLSLERAATNEVLTQKIWLHN
ncbi:hypothetical protein [Spirosoma aerophilum]